MGSNMSTVEESRAHVTTSSTMSSMGAFDPHLHHARSHFDKNHNGFPNRRISTNAVGAATVTVTPSQTMSSIMNVAAKTTTNRIMTFHSWPSWNGFIECSKAFNNLVLTYFSNAWYEPCRYMEPIFKELAIKYTNVEFVKIDVDELHGLSRHYGVRETPTFVLIKKGKVVDKIVGPTKNDLQRKIEKYMV